MSVSEFRVEVQTADDRTAVKLSGAATLHTVASLCDRLDHLDFGGTYDIDLGALDRLDTAGGWALCRFEGQVTGAGGSVRIENASGDVALLLGNVRQSLPKPDVGPQRPAGLSAFLAAVGQGLATGAGFLRELVGYLGLFFARLGRAVLHPREFRFTSLVAHCEDVGLRAVPIVALMAFLIGVVLAFQGAAQLRQFGAEVFVVDLIAISILRELGILLTAIIVAGRTASAFTAAIGSMKMREEIDAMRTLGLDPAMVLFVPRILALLLMLPILGLIANVVGLLGGALMAWIELGISPAMFRTRLIDGTDVSHVFVGLVKAPFFALIIGIVGCHAGMQVKGNAESLGRMTSNAVVTAIFAVIVVDAMFSIFFSQVGL